MRGLVVRGFYLLVFNISFGMGQDWEGKHCEHYKNKQRRFLQLTESGVSVGSLAVQLEEDTTEDWEEESCSMSVRRIMFCLEKGQESVRRMVVGLAVFLYAVRFIIDFCFHLPQKLHAILSQDTLCPPASPPCSPPPWLITSPL